MPDPPVKKPVKPVIRWHSISCVCPECLRTDERAQCIGSADIIFTRVVLAPGETVVPARLAS